MPLFQDECKCETYMQFHFHANQSHFQKNGFALRLALKQRHKGTRKWPIQRIILDRPMKHSASELPEDGPPRYAHKSGSWYLIGEREPSLFLPSDLGITNSVLFPIHRKEKDGDWYFYL